MNVFLKAIGDRGEYILYLNLTKFNMTSKQKLFRIPTSI